MEKFIEVTEAFTEKKSIIDKEAVSGLFPVDMGHKGTYTKLLFKDTSSSIVLFPPYHILKAWIGSCQEKDQ